MRRVLAPNSGGELYAKRQTMIEPIIADAKFNRRIDRLLRRGRSAARPEWRLTNAAHNSRSCGDTPRRSRRPEKVRRPAADASRSTTRSPASAGNEPVPRLPQQPPTQGTRAAPAHWLTDPPGQG